MSATPPTSTSRVEVIVINGASSSGKTTLAGALQDALAESWLIFGIDTLISALPLALLEIHDDATIVRRPRDHHVRDGGLSFDADGNVSAGPEFQRLEASWRDGLSAIAASGTLLILDEVFLDGGPSQDRLRRALAGNVVAWVGVTCDDEVAKVRERERGDRVVGMYERQVTRVHQDVLYDLVVDTTERPAHEVAREIAEHFRLAVA